MYENALEIKNLYKSYGDFEALKNINLTIKKGDFFGFLGRNGAGKTTTIHTICGINKFDAGSIEVCGHDVIHDERAAKTSIGLSSQEYNVDMFMPLKKILWNMGGLYGVPAKTRKVRIEELLTIFNLKEHQNKTFRHLSGGMKRRAILARAMIHDPELLILDEPTAGLDIELRHELWEYLLKINKMGKTILLTSHYLEEVEILCETIAIIHLGKMIKVDKKENYLKDGIRLEKQFMDMTKEVR